jgi:hypothetical protein
MIKQSKHYFYIIICLILLNGCDQSIEKSSIKISNQTRKEATAALEKFAKIRTAIPADPKAYLALFANDDRFMIGGNDGFKTDYQAFYNRVIKNPENLNPKWVIQFNFKFRDLKIIQIDTKNLLFITYFDEFVKSKSGDTLSLKNNVIHGSLTKIEGEWKILTMLYSHNAADEKLSNDFDARNE